MKKPRETAHVVFRARLRGGVLLLALFLLVLMGVFAGMQAAALAGILRSGGALGQSSDRSALVSMLGRVVEESLLSETEDTLVPQPSLEQRVRGLLDRARPAGWSLALAECSSSGNRTAPGYPWRPFVSDTALQTSPVLAWARADQREGFGSWMLLGSQRACSFRVEALHRRGAPPSLVRFEAMSVGLPLFSKGVFGYMLPDEMASAAETAAGLPWHFRVRGSKAAAYARIFSKQWLDEVMLWAGPWAVQPMLAGGVEAGVIDAYGRSGSVAVLDLAKAGAGVSEGVRRESSSLFLLMQRGSGDLRLEESSAASGARPLMLVVVGSKDAGSRVLLHSVSRPVILLAVNVELRCEGPVSWAGALVLAPGSRLSGTESGLQVAHLSLPTSMGKLPGVQASLPLPSTLYGVSPGYACTLVSPPREEPIL